MSRKGMAHLRWHNYDALKDAYYSSYPTAPYLLGTYADNEDDNISFGLYHIVEFYIDMYDISNDNAWLTLAFATTDHILNVTDEARDGRGDITIEPLEDPATTNNYYQAPYPLQLNGIASKGWSSFDGSAGGRLRNQVLQDGQILGCFAHLADYVLENNITAWNTKANELVDYCKLVIDIHLPSWREGRTKNDIYCEGSFYYPERLTGADSIYTTPLAYNHAGGYMTAMLCYDKYRVDASYVAMADKFMQYIRDTRTEYSDRYLWGYTQAVGSVEDLNHGSYYVGNTFLFAYENNYLGITESEMQKYAGAVLNAWLTGKVGVVAEKIDGSGTIPAGEAFNVGQMMALGSFNPDIYKMSRDLSAISYINSYLSMFHCYSKILRYIPDNIRK